MTTVEAADGIRVSRRGNMKLVSAAVHRHTPFSRAGISERLFTLSFSGLVYPQIWEDPRVDIEAMGLAPKQHVVAIASGGCNILSYLSAAPIEITAVDLNAAHIALNRLKITAARHLDDHADFARFFADARSTKNIEVFDTLIAPHLDADTKAYWSGRDWCGRRRIEAFSRGFYRTGLLGRFIAMGHVAARFFGGDPKAVLKARSIEEQRQIFDEQLRPLFSRPMVQRLLDSPSALFGLGIPPAQYEALSEGRPMHEVIVERLEKLACGFPLSDNYFTWQAFNRGYAANDGGPLPPYLQAQNFEKIKTASNRIQLLNTPFTDHLMTLPSRRVDRFVLLDAQDWMTDSDLNVLWREISRTARPRARVIFRTAGRDTILPNRIRAGLLNQWTYRQEQSAELTRKDRSAIYGGFHLYEKVD